jgi:hypothetical protein
LDDYQDVALRMADWQVLAPEAEVVVFRDHLADEDAVVQRLQDFDIVVPCASVRLFNAACCNGCRSYGCW